MAVERVVLSDSAFSKMSTIGSEQAAVVERQDI
jgi:hypothetical protein